jgi:alkyl hydroperoxide reductase subunit AhpC
MPRLNEPAPGFEAKTTHGTRRLSDYKGKWLVLFSHPADFTPVCTTEFIGFAKAWPEFQKLNCELLGLSIDSTFANIAWVRRGQRHVGRSRDILHRRQGHLPEVWLPGDPVIVPPPQTTQAAEARAGEGYDYTDWYFSRKTL